MAFAPSLLTCALCIALATPGFAQTQDTQPLPDSPLAQTNNQGQASAAPSDSSLQKPAGTAAAPTPKITGVAGSEPAGAAYAPAKQRRVRILLIKVGAVVAAGAAVGAVAALSHASPSQPPGAH